MSALTEDVARTRWCPFARTMDVFNHPVAVGRDGVNMDGRPAWPAACACIGSACMAWRWAGAGTVKRSYLRSTGESLEENRAYLIADVVTKEEPNSDRRGFCGLVGAAR